ncbi:hypothetical protein TRAPUB_11360 [Trametes pubescens]|uniref:Uncharacterized protein n=1 Tax=Trametes pubescens TaxID=154538 RepID=A0A1M2VWW1_TRAPU|nr:hypothetical protein TRAPUB_11360 [Trametes pubescens]
MSPQETCKACVRRRPDIDAAKFKARARWSVDLAQNYVHFQVERSRSEATERRNAASDDSPYGYFGHISALQTCKGLLKLRGWGG